jgi:hypothetical protein
VLDAFPDILSAEESHGGQNCGFWFWKEVFPFRKNERQTSRPSSFFYNGCISRIFCMHFCLLQCRKETTVLRNFLDFIFFVQRRARFYDNFRREPSLIFLFLIKRDLYYVIKRFMESNLQSLPRRAHFQDYVPILNIFPAVWKSKTVHNCGIDGWQLKESMLS